MFSSVLVANRGEIAVRIMRTAKRLGMRTIAVCSEADSNAMHVAMADEAYEIGPAAAVDSYLNIDRIIETARKSGAECIHPGYGFLSENALFAAAIAKEGLAFVGPPIEALQLMGLKDIAKARMKEAGVPTVPGYAGEEQDVETLFGAAEDIGYPVMVKAVAGGGGKGMRKVHSPDDFKDAVEGARREAEAAFGDGKILVEKYLERPRHVEVQVFADAHGNCVHLFERDCSLQRRQQKIFEEAPAPGMTQGLRSAMTDAAIAAAKAVGYVGAGTIEFLTEGGPLGDQTPFYFLEMNTRLQVEHPVTEAVTGTDLVEWQFLVASGGLMPLGQDALELQGHAVEARVYAEDPERGFIPSSGQLKRLAWPEHDGIRIDTGVREGDEVTPFYDPMVAKMIAHAPTREEAMALLQSGLAETVVAGPRTNLNFVHTLLDRPDVVAGVPDTGLVERVLPELLPEGVDPVAIARGTETLVAMAQTQVEACRVHGSNDHASPWSAGDGFTLGTRRPDTVKILCNGEPMAVDVAWGPDGPTASGVAMPDADREQPVHMVPTDAGILVVHDMRQWEIALPDFASSEADGASAGGEIKAPMHGKITQVFAKEGQAVEKGARIAVLEAMKMEHILHAPHDGIIEALPVKDGTQVEEGALVARIGETEA